MKKFVNVANSPNQKSPQGFVLSPSNLFTDLPAPILSSKYQTPTSHRKTNSWAQSTSNLRKLTPSKSRFDNSAIQVSNLDIRACEADYQRVQKLQKFEELREKAQSRDEWYQLNNQRKKQIEEDHIKHQSCMIKEQTELKKAAEEKEKEEKEIRKMNKEQDFKEFNKAKKKLISKEKEVEKKNLLDECEKLKVRQKQREEEKERVRQEREEKRKWRMEEIEALRKIRDDEKLRLKKEREYEREQYALGLISKTYERHIC